MSDDLAAKGRVVSDRLTAEGVGRVQGTELNGHEPKDIPLPAEPADIPSPLGEHPPDDDQDEREKETEAEDEDEDESKSGKGKKSDPRQSIAAQVVHLAQANYNLRVTDADEPFGVRGDRPHIALMLRGGRTGLRAELARRFFALTKIVPSQQALADACMVLEGYAQQEDPRRVHLRVAERGGVVYIDMGDKQCRVIKISCGEWEVVDTAPVLFRGTKLTGAMPQPHSGDLSRLWEHVPIDEADRPVLLAWLVQALLQPDTPHPVLGLLAEHGSATITRFLVSLVDPSSTPLRKDPRDADTWVTAAAASWVVALDNLSGVVPQWLSDALCRAVTGDGDVKRALYTDNDVAVVSFRRVVIFNGVDVQINAGDLADRLLAVDLRRITEDDRREDAKVAEQWAADYPVILAGLLDLAAKVHQKLPGIRVDKLPRMADYAKVLAAVDQLGDTEGLSRYRERAKRAAYDTLTDSFVAELITRNYSCEGKTSAEILKSLTPTSPEWKPPKDWPGNARSVTAQLTRHAPALRQQGWTIEHDDGRNEAKVRKWTIRGPETVRNADPSDPSNPSSQVNGQKYDGSDETLFPVAARDNPSDGSDGDDTGQAETADPSENVASTSRDGSTGQTGQHCAPSLVCEACGGELKRPESIALGRCRECALIHPRPQQTWAGGEQ